MLTLVSTWRWQYDDAETLTGTKFVIAWGEAMRQSRRRGDISSVNEIAALRSQ